MCASAIRFFFFFFFFLLFDGKIPLRMKTEQCTSAWHSKLSMSSQHCKQWSSTGGEFFSIRGYVAMSRDITGCHDWEGTTGLLSIEARNATEHPSVHRTAPQNRELSSSTCQWCRGWETLLKGKSHWPSRICLICKLLCRTKQLNDILYIMSIAYWIVFWVSLDEIEELYDTNIWSRLLNINSWTCQCPHALGFSQDTLF